MISEGFIELGDNGFLVTDLGVLGGFQGLSSCQFGVSSSDGSGNGGDLSVGGGDDSTLGAVIGGCGGQSGLEWGQDCLLSGDSSQSGSIGGSFFGGQSLEGDQVGGEGNFVGLSGCFLELGSGDERIIACGGAESGSEEPGDNDLLVHDCKGVSSFNK